MMLWTPEVKGVNACGGRAMPAKQRWRVQVRQDWGIRESVGQQGWQGIMRQYLRQDRQEAARLAAELATAGATPATPSSRRKQTGSCTEGVSDVHDVRDVPEMQIYLVLR